MWKGWARLASGVWYRELESMDNESTPPIWTEEFELVGDKFLLESSFCRSQV